MLIEINNEDIDELFEILCEIPFREANSWDMEPPTERPAGIDYIIDQLLEVMEEEDEF